MNDENNLKTIINQFKFTDFITLYINIFYCWRINKRNDNKTKVNII